LGCLRLGCSWGLHQRRRCVLCASRVWRHGDSRCGAGGARDHRGWGTPAAYASRCCPAGCRRCPAGSRCCPGGCGCGPARRRGRSHGRRPDGHRRGCWVLFPRVLTSGGANHCPGCGPGNGCRGCDARRSRARGAGCCPGYPRVHHHGGAGPGRALLRAVGTSGGLVTANAEVKPPTTHPLTRPPVDSSTRTLSLPHPSSDSRLRGAWLGPAIVITCVGSFACKLHAPP
jgi:hypothetical protein